MIDTSLALGLGPREGKGSPLLKSVGRLTQFELARETSDGTVAVRRSLPPINRRHIRRLPDHLRDAHEEWVAARLDEAPLAAAQAKARRMAFTMLELGDDVDHAERTLFAAGFHPAICREAATWAWERHRSARFEAVGGATPVTRRPRTATANATTPAPTPPPAAA